MSESSVDAIREYIVICGRAHIVVNNMHKFTIAEAQTLKSNMEKSLKDKMNVLGDAPRAKKQLEWKLATLRVEKVILN